MHSLKTKFDGTKLPLVVYPSLNHNQWYELPLLGKSPYRNFPHDCPALSQPEP